MAIEDERQTLQEIVDRIEHELMLSRARDFWQGSGVRSMPVSTMEHVQGMHDIRHQQSIPHSTGQGTAFQRLDRLARERLRLLKRARLWASKLVRERENIVQVDRERDLLLRILRPHIEKELRGVPAGPLPPPPGRAAPQGQGETLEY